MRIGLFLILMSRMRSRITYFSLLAAFVLGHPATAGRLIVLDSTKKAVIEVDPLTGSQTVLAEGDLLVAPTGMTLMTDRAAAVTNSNGTVIGVDLISGAQTLLSAGGQLVSPLAIGAVGAFSDCADGLDNEGDGDIDQADAGCVQGAEDFPCDDGVDNDGDGDIDWEQDAACLGDPTSGREGTVCDNGADDDGDGLTDWEEDPQCGGNPVHYSELPASPGGRCGLGTELVVLLPVWWGIRRWRRRS